MIHSCTVHPHQLCSYRWPGLLSQAAFANPVRPCWCITGSVGPLGSTNQNCLCVRLCQWPSWSILWFVYIPVVCWKCSTTVCGLMAGRARLRLAHPPPPPPAFLSPTHPLISAIRDITVEIKKLSQKPEGNTARQS